MHTHTKSKSVRAVALSALLGLLAPLLVVMTFTAAANAGSPTDPQNYAGFFGEPVNDYGWYNPPHSQGAQVGSYILPTSTGGSIIGYCIQRGASDPWRAGPVSEVADLPAARGVSAESRQALAYTLWKYGNTQDDVTAAAVSLIAHAETNDFGQEGLPGQRNFWDVDGNGIPWGDPSLGVAGVEVTRTTPAGSVFGWNNGLGDATKQRAIDIWNEALSLRGPWTVSVDVTGETAPLQATVTVTSATGAPVPGVTVGLDYTNATNADGSGTTNAAGQIVVDLTPADMASPVRVDATATGPGYYKVYQGGNAQSVVTSGGNAPYSGSGQGEVTMAQIQVAKVSTNPTYQSGHGAIFELHQGDENGPVVGELTVGPDGLSNVIGNLEEGTYTAVEVHAPEGQILDPTPITAVLLAGDSFVVEAANEVVPEASLSFEKLDDETDEPLEGATIQIAYDSDGDGTYETLIGDGPDGEAGSDDDGIYLSELDPVTIDGLLVGRYQVSEIAPPDGYTLPEMDMRVQTVELTYGDQTNPDDNVLSVLVNFRNKVPMIHTQVTTAPVEDDPETPDVDESQEALPSNLMELSEDGTLSFADMVILENVASDLPGTITANLYGPFESSEYIVCEDGTLAGTESWSVTGSGTFSSPVFTVDEAGIYTFVETWEGEDGSSASHECGVESETVSVPDLETKASDAVTIGESITDTAIVTGVTDGTEGVVTADLYGPFDSLEDIVCTEETLFATQDYNVVGSGEFVSPEFPIDEMGVYTFIETWTEVVEDGDEPVVVSHECGLTEETTVVNPDLKTQVSNQEINVGESVYDTSILTGVPGDIEGIATFNLYGPFDSIEDAVCDETKLVDTVTARTIGSGEVASPAVTVNEAGVYTFVETWESDDGTFEATHECGMDAETFTVINPNQGGGGGLLAYTGSTVFPLMILSGVLAGLGALALVASRREDLAGE